MVLYLVALIEFSIRIYAVQALTVDLKFTVLTLISRRHLIKSITLCYYIKLELQVSRALCLLYLGHVCLEENHVLLMVTSQYPCLCYRESSKGRF